MIRAGLLLAALSPLILPLLGASLTSVVGFVLLLTAGDLIYNPRMDAYAMAVSPAGREGVFSGASSAAVFLADVPVGFLGGLLLERFCPRAEGNDQVACDTAGLFGSLAAFSLISPVLLFCCGQLLREPTALEVPESKLPEDAEELVALGASDGHAHRSAAAATRVGRPVEDDDL